MELGTLILKNWWATRYVPESIQILLSFDDVIADKKEKSELFLISILQAAKNPLLNTRDLRFPDYTLPKSILEDNIKVRQIIAEKVNELLTQRNLNWADTKKFLIDNHENIKRVQNRWFAANPGLLLEWIKITDDYQKILIDWLANQGVNVGDNTIHLHVISNSGRQKIKAMEFEVPFDHWHESYYKNMLLKCVEIMEANPNVKGLFCDSSWVHNPQNFNIAPDGLPFVSFDF